jgi:hypothetical protein
MPGEERLPEDADLTGLLCRRIVFEGLLRQAVAAEPTVDLRAGCPVAGLLAEPSPLDGVPRVVGVRTRDHAEVGAETVILAGGRLQPVPDWLTAIGVRMPAEEAEGTGRVTYTRHFRVRPRAGEDHMVMASLLGVFELGYLLYGLGGCDQRTFYLEFNVPAGDTDLHGLHEEAVFMAAARSMTDAAPWLTPERSDPIGRVAPMGQERNLVRRFVREGRPISLGLPHALALGMAPC